MLEAFFKRALAWEKGSQEENEEAAVISLSDERDGVFTYTRGHEMRVLLEAYRRHSGSTQENRSRNVSIL